MKRLFAALCTSAILVGCSLDELRHEISPSSGRAFSVEQAREFFEKDYVDRLTKSQDVDTRAGRFRGRIHPGDFTPLWDKSVYSESDGVAAYDIDILAERSIFAIRSKFGPSGAKAQKLKVYQKLVVRLNVESGKMAAYVMSIIPDVGCDDRRIPERFSSRGKDKGGFSGIVVYATTERGAIVRVQEYKGGVKKRGVYIPSGKGSYIDRCVKAREILKGVTLMSKRNILTRSGEDDWGDYYGGELDGSICIGDNAGSYGLEYLGDGIYTDGEGHYYLDIDEDGYIDMETIAPGHIEDDGPEDPEDLWSDGNENGNGNENEGDNDGGETGGDDEIYGDAHYNDNYIVLPSPLTEFIGHPEFYNRRHDDFKNRFPNRNAPGYYKEYGYKYCKRFQDETRLKLSEAGKEWVDKTLVALQLKLNAIIMKDPLLEFNGEELKKAAYESHVSAYIESGVLELPLSDKVEILLTVEWKDLSSPEGRQQVGDIIEAQIVHYIIHPGDALSDASYLMNNFSDILSRIRTYYHDNTQSAQPETKGITPALSEEYIYELILGPLIEYYEENIPGFSLPGN